MPHLTQAERDSQQRLLNKYLEQFEQLHQTLVDTIGQAEQLNDQLERVYDQLLLRPEHEQLQQLKPLLESMPTTGFNELQQHVQNLVVALQSNRADIEVQLRRCRPPEELRTRRLTRPLLLRTLQQLTALLERVSLNTRQLHSRLKRIVGKQLKRFHVSLTDRLLERLLQMELDEPLLKLDRFVTIVFGTRAPNNISNLPKMRTETETVITGNLLLKVADPIAPTAATISRSSPSSTNDQNRLQFDDDRTLTPNRSAVQDPILIPSPPQPTNTTTALSSSRLANESTADLWAFCRLLSRCYLSLSGLCVALHTLFEFVAGICEHFFANHLIAEIEQQPFADIFDFTARIANKMRTDHLKEHEQPILVHPARLQQQKQQQLRLAVIAVISIFFCISVIITITLYWMKHVTKNAQ